MEEAAYLDSEPKKSTFEVREQPLSNLISFKTATAEEVEAAKHKGFQSLMGILVHFRRRRLEGCASGVRGRLWLDVFEVGCEAVLHLLDDGGTRDLDRAVLVILLEDQSHEGVHVGVVLHMPFSKSAT